MLSFLLFFSLVGTRFVWRKSSLFRSRFCLTTVSSDDDCWLLFVCIIIDSFWITFKPSRLNRTFWEFCNIKFIYLKLMLKLKFVLLLSLDHRFSLGWLRDSAFVVASFSRTGTEVSLVFVLFVLILWFTFFFNAGYASLLKECNL